MKAKILEKSEYKEWDKFLNGHPLSSIHQTSNWGEFQEKVPSRGKFWIVALEEDGKIIGGTMLIRHLLPRGYSWLYAARGPLMDYSSEPEKQMEKLSQQIQKIAKKEKSIFMRIDPPLQVSPPSLSSPSSPSSPPAPHLKGFYKAHGFQPEHTLIIDLDKTEEEILADMKQKGRYNIKIAEKKGVEIYKADPKNEDDFSRFHEILQETTSRDGFFAHNKDYYKDMVETLSASQPSSTPSSSTAAHSSTSPLACLYLAKYQGKIIAGIIVTFFKDTAIYYYGASSNEHRNVMAPYLLQWTAIREAKGKGLKYYDFLGIAPEDAKDHPWKGVTQFKKKFGGHIVSYSPAQEKPLKPLHYWAYKLYKELRTRLKTRR